MDTDQDLKRNHEKFNSAFETLWAELYQNLFLTNIKYLNLELLKTDLKIALKGYVEEMTNYLREDDSWQSCVTDNFVEKHGDLLYGGIRASKFGYLTNYCSYEYQSRTSKDQDVRHLLQDFLRAQGMYVGFV